MRIFDFEEAPAFTLRGYQKEWMAAVEADRAAGYSRLLIDAPGGTGKSSFFAAIAKKEWIERNGRTLILENRDKLVRQSAQRIRDETGLEVDIEMSDERASPFVPIVVASVPTLGRVNRLSGFADSHFSLVVPDEAHYSLAPQWQRVIRYFHYGAGSLDDHFAVPVDGTYEPKSCVVGTTATPDLGKKKNLGELFQKFSVRYSYLQAVQDGWLVPPIAKSIPLKIDLRKFRTGRTPNGSDFKPEDLNAAMIPIIEKCADQIVEHASDRKTMAFLPSVECARLMADAIQRRGLRSIFVSGECLDVDEKTNAFHAAGPGTVLSNCCIYVAGVDFPDVSCIAWFRATLSRPFFIQGIYRAARTLPGLVNDSMTADQRREIISLSAKPNMLILDPLYITDRIDLCSIYDLFCDKPEVKALMKEMDGMDMLEAAKKAERDFIKSLEKEAKKHANKQARVIDPLAWAVNIGEEKLASYVPVEKWEFDPITSGQKAQLEKLHIDCTKVLTKGLAQKLLGIMFTRLDHKLATPLQLDFMHRLGIDEQTRSTVTMREASALIDRTKAARMAR